MLKARGSVALAALAVGMFLVGVPSACSEEQPQWQQDAIAWLVAGLEELDLTPHHWDAMSQNERGDTIDRLILMGFTYMGLDYDDLLMNSGLKPEEFRAWMMGLDYDDLLM